MTLKITIDKVGDVLKGLETLERNRVLVGIPADNTDRKNEDGTTNPVNNAMIGLWMENGAPEANIPARPHLRPGVASVRDKIAAIYKKAGEQVLTGDASAADRAHHKVGLIAQNAVRKKITDGPFEPLSERTLAKRRRHGRTGERPLIDTGQYRSSITYVIRKKGE